MKDQKASETSFWFAMISFWFLSSVLLLLIYKVIPVFGEIYQGFGARLPSVLVLVMNWSALMRSLFLVTFPVMLAGIAGITFLMWRGAGRIPLSIFPLMTFVLIAIMVLVCFLPVVKLSDPVR